ncbi:MAG: acyltransferase family protein [Bacteroidaceae bacterium]|nr:acyltransferase family protein [Bacteroidaceae bacterium]
MAVCIVLIHLHMQVNGTQIEWGSLTSMDAWRLFACVSINELASIAVPLFFMISGFLFFYKSQGIPNAQWWLGKLRRRVRTLLIPYVLFCLLAVIGLVINHTMQGHSLSDSLQTFLGNGKWFHNFWDVHTTGTNTNILGITKPISYPICIPLWFIRDLMVIVLMTPLIRWVLLKLRLGWIAIMLVLSLTGIWIPLVGFSPSSCLWFSIGAWFSMRGVSMAASLQPLRVPLLCAAIPLLVVDILTDGTPSDRYVHFAFLMVAVPAVYAISSLALPLYGGAGRGSVSLSFFIFAFHTLPLPFLGCRPVEWAKQLLWTNSDNGWLCILQFVGAALLTVAVCLLVYLLLRWICPRFLFLLTGRKN